MPKMRPERLDVIGTQNSLYEDNLTGDGIPMTGDIIRKGNGRIITRGEIAGGNDGASMPTEIIMPGNRQKKHSHIITPDELPFYRGFMPGQDENKGFFQRWKEYREMVRKEYPIVRGKELKNAWRLPLYYMGKEICKNISSSWFPEQSRTDLLNNTLGTFFDAMCVTYNQQFGVGMYSTFPRIRVFSAFSDDATNIERVYTLEVDDLGVTYELPVYLQKFDEDKPTDAILTRNADFTKQHGISPYNKIESMATGYIRKYFNQFGIEKFSRGDFKRYFHDEPEKFFRWIGRDSTWHIVQYGDRDAATESALPPMAAGKIKVYETTTKTSGFWYDLGRVMGDDSPSSWSSFLYWQLGDWIYDGVDLLFGPAEAILTASNIPKPAVRTIMDLEYKVAAASRRGLFRGRGINFEYELPSVSASSSKIAAAQQDAVHSFGYR